MAHSFINISLDNSEGLIKKGGIYYGKKLERIIELLESIDDELSDIKRNVSWIESNTSDIRDISATLEELKKKAKKS